MINMVIEGNTDAKRVKQNTTSKPCLIFTFILLYVSVDTVLFGTNYDNRFIVAQYVILALTALSLIIRTIKKRITFEKSIISIAVVLAMLSFITGVLNSDLGIKYIYEAVILVIAILYVANFTWGEFSRSYIIVMCVISTFALLLILINLVVPSLLTHLPYVTNSVLHGYRFAGLGLIKVLGGEASRSISVFREPAVYGIFLLLALLMLLFSDKHGIKSKLPLVILFLLAIETTHSSGAVACTAIAFIIYLLQLTSKKLSRFQWLMVFAGLAVLLVILFVIDPFDSYEFSKFGNQQYTSWADRSFSFLGNLIIFANHPIFGGGWDNGIAEFLLLSSQNSLYSTGANTNTFLRILSVHGAPYFLIWLFGMYGYCRRLSEKSFIRFLLLILLFLLLANANLTFNVVVSIMVVYGWESQFDWLVLSGNISAMNQSTKRRIKAPSATANYPEKATS